ncbi:MAG: Holliday junction resolvase RuvX [Bacteroidia bacterium]
MGRIMAIDYGTKRVGIAVSDPSRIIASGLTTVHAKDIISFLKEYFQKEKVDVVVLGDPKKMDNTPSESSRYVEAFLKNLQKTFPDLRIERVDERFTSKMAFQTMIDSGLKKKDRQNKELVDEISATLILQTFMQGNGK